MLYFIIIFHKYKFKKLKKMISNNNNNNITIIAYLQSIKFVEIYELTAEVLQLLLFIRLKIYL
jgi:hypothetical protein